MNSLFHENGKEDSSHQINIDLFNFQDDDPIMVTVKEKTPYNALGCEVDVPEGITIDSRIFGIKSPFIVEYDRYARERGSYYFISPSVGENHYIRLYDESDPDEPDLIMFIVLCCAAGIYTLHKHNIIVGRSNANVNYLIHQIDNPDSFFMIAKYGGYHKKDIEHPEEDFKMLDYLIEPLLDHYSLDTDKYNNDTHTVEDILTGNVPFSMFYTEKCNNIRKIIQKEYPEIKFLSEEEMKAVNEKYQKEKTPVSSENSESQSESKSEYSQYSDPNRISIKRLEEIKDKSIFQTRVRYSPDDFDRSKILCLNIDSSKDIDKIQIDPNAFNINVPILIPQDKYAIDVTNRKFFFVRRNTEVYTLLKDHNEVINYDDNEKHCVLYSIAASLIYLHKK